jgi:hypothetical protein
MKPLLILLAIAVCAATGAAAVGCNSTSSNASGGDDGGSCAPIDSACGQPCDPGNSLGVGQFCNHIPDCTNTPQAHLCSSFGSASTHFCTFRCSLPDAATDDGGDGGLPFPTDCGEGAICTCDNSGNCGCTPATCLGM